MPFETCSAPTDPFGDWPCQDDATAAVLAIVVETQPIAHPPKTKSTLCVVSCLPLAATTAKPTAQTTKQPMLYAQ